MTAPAMLRYDDPRELATAIARCPLPLLICLDVDGVLAPIVDHADDARLLDGMADATGALASIDHVHTAVISGRSVEDLARFAFVEGIDVVGSHGMESRGRPMSPLSDAEQAVMVRLDSLASGAARTAGDGAWVERKPASVVLHVRQADPALGTTALTRLGTDTAGIDGATSKAGSGVLELFARTADKGTAMSELRDRVGAATTVFVGDDVTDEDAFAQLGNGDVAIKVGEADTIATHRLADPPAVLHCLRALDQALHGTPGV